MHTAVIYEAGCIKSMPVPYMPCKQTKLTMVIKPKLQVVLWFVLPHSLLAVLAMVDSSITDLLVSIGSNDCK